MSECWERNNWKDPRAEALEKLQKPTETSQELLKLLGVNMKKGSESGEMIRNELVKKWDPKPLVKDHSEMNNAIKEPKSIFYMHGKKLFTERAIVPPEMGAIYIAELGNGSSVPAGTKLKVIGVNKFKATSVNSALYIVQLSVLN